MINFACEQKMNVPFFLKEVKKCLLITWVSQKIYTICI